MTAPFGRFLELSLATPDIGASVAFYEQLGFAQYVTGDAWPHRYGVMGDGRIHLGLHECKLPSPMVSFVLPGLVRAQAALAAQGLSAELRHVGEEELHWLRLRDPGGHALALLEARTFSPSPLSGVDESLCGYFQHLSLPQSDFQAARLFWERAGLITLPPEEAPFPHLPLISDPLNLAFHRAGLFPAPLLVFACPAVAAVRTRLLARGVRLSEDRPRALAVSDALLLRAPEGTALLLAQAQP